MLAEIHVHHLRVIQSFKSVLSPSCNFVYGENGCGKTSFLEAIALLSRGRSFRSHLAKDYIQYGSAEAIVRGVLLNDDVVAVSRPLHGKATLLYNQKELSSLITLTQQLPTQVINQQSFELLTGASQLRRDFIDWGMFHVEHSSLLLWKQFRQSVEQRNIALRQGLSANQLEAWNQAFCRLAMIVDSQRQAYTTDFIGLFQQTVRTLLPYPVNIEYFRGWNQDISLSEALMRDLEKDRRQGYTHSGPQRADLKILIENRPASSVLSRGQQKLLVMALLLARGLLFYQSTQKSCLYLIDDLPAELDLQNQDHVFQSLMSINAQVFLTTIEKPNHFLSKQPQAQLFHVKQQGVIDLCT